MQKKTDLIFLTESTRKKNTLSQSGVIKLWSSIFRLRLYTDVTICGYFATVSPSLLCICHRCILREKDTLCTGVLSAINCSPHS